MRTAQLGRNFAVETELKIYVLMKFIQLIGFTFIYSKRINCVFSSLLRSLDGENGFSLASELYYLAIGSGLFNKLTFHRASLCTLNVHTNRTYHTINCHLNCEHECECFEFCVLFCLQKDLQRNNRMMIRTHNFMFQQ